MEEYFIEECLISGAVILLILLIFLLTRRKKKQDPVEALIITRLYEALNSSSQAEFITKATQLWAAYRAINNLPQKSDKE